MIVTPLISTSQNRTVSAWCASWREGNHVGRVVVFSELRWNTTALEPSEMWAVSNRVVASSTTARDETSENVMN